MRGAIEDGPCLWLEDVSGQAALARVAKRNAETAQAPPGWAAMDLRARNSEAGRVGDWRGGCRSVSSPRRYQGVSSGSPRRPDEDAHLREDVTFEAVRRCAAHERPDVSRRRDTAAGRTGAVRGGQAPRSTGPMRVPVATLSLP
ncbi:hypothetical protein C5746_01530 [Streptomyces atratus]|uniref:Uncharacterized protein n=1 Tax=Streptomyces atratus TaxID=1893 RepID=A0A2Z5J6C0_STRAR|nr:hypothetical protein C5746_01530 [Streptomyces atratus]